MDFWILLILLLAGGLLVTTFLLIRRIDKHKKAEAQIIAAKEKAEESDRLKTAFLHNISHEIRTPMNAIIGFSTLLNEKGLNEHERRQYTDFIFSSARNLLSIINDIVDIANIESGKARVTLAKMNVNSTLKMINDQFRSKDMPAGIRLEMRLSLPDNEADIISDETKLVQVITNLLNNSVKFTSNGSIEFGYTRKDDFLEFYVNDTGIGIPEDHQARIFDRFYQVDDAATRKYGGTGLGLSICKSYVGLLGGEIRLKSKPGEGTSFTFTIPFRQNTGNLQF
jgi:signal transduction histidine kinase